MKTIYYGATSLNGFIADENNSLDWLFQFSDGDVPQSYTNFIKDVGAICMGSHTYEWMWENQISKAEDPAKAWPYQMPAFVFTTRKLVEIPGADVRFVQGDVRPVFEAMKNAAGGKNLWVVGGGELAAKFYDAGLLDELILQVAPLTLAGGAPLFPRKIHPPMKLISAEAIKNLFVELKYKISQKES
ncbi:dihydrofolate reductase family protein [Bdellovibrio sp. SKB1291214]|uniref:dihydrofolate reductase family protein n=1 Tax=Bdellovibrio sp. SKB1291214 TaxID=1732569 RepID=UPI000B5167DA|nr:dihydrofolate reductase family protein [Bdellovibrio sp. SKB1291214]UYL09438.1 dihydrofolate reductase family protein [Bdellovibrio sp. SKB1291214]